MIDYIILGIVQGITEFLPVSSSGHLAVLGKLFGLQEQGIAISIVMHLGTLLAVIIFFFRDILEAFSSRRMLAQILIVTLITGVIGVAGRDFFESAFSSIKIVAAGWIASGVILLLTARFMHSIRKEVSVKDSVILGFAQAAAIFPGVSRSGITISTMLFRGVEKMKGFRFSFVASIPAIAGAALLEARDINSAFSADGAKLAVGFFCSFASGMFALWFLKRALAKARFHYFSYYCFAAALIALIFVK
jgi:undecaprenyl-diphosphatase